MANKKVSKEIEKKKINKKYFYTTVIIAVTVVLAVIMIILCLQFGQKNDQNVAFDAEVDYGQKVTSIDGSEFNATYQQDGESDFVVRFSDLQCDEDCLNVGMVKLGNKVLVRGKDYEVKQGSVILILLNEFLKTIQNGQYDLVVEVGQLVVGVHINIEQKTPVCDNNEILKDNQCIEEEKDENIGHDSNQQGSVDKSESNLESWHESGVNQDKKPQETEPKTSQDPVVEPEPEPEPEPILNPNPQYEFNLNDGYYVEYFGMQFVRINHETHECILDESGRCVDEKDSGHCSIVRYADYSAPVIKTTYWTSDNYGITEAQAKAEEASWRADGLEPAWGSGFIFQLDEHYCTICGLSCSRW